MELGGFKKSFLVHLHNIWIGPWANFYQYVPGAFLIFQLDCLVQCLNNPTCVTALTDETDADGAQVICKGFDDMPSEILLQRQEMWKITGREAGHCIKTCLPGFLRGGPRCYHIPEDTDDDWRGDWTMAKELCENLSTAEVTVHLAGKKETKVVVYIVVLEQVQHVGLVDLRAPESHVVRDSPSKGCT